jgi:transcriptional regulator with XRE-family HTH domain
MKIKDRIKAIMIKENILSRVFAESIGIQQSTLSHILNGRNNPSLDVIMKIHQKYNYLDLEWLLYGTGEMTVTQQSINKSKNGSEPSLFNETLFPDKNQNKKKSESDRKQFIPPSSHEIHTKEIVRQEIKYIEKTQRKITEIRIFFDDNTFEIFKSDNK